jgi:hypothetical protein
MTEKLEKLKRSVEEYADIIKEQGGLTTSDLKEILGFADRTSIPKWIKKKGITPLIKSKGKNKTIYSVDIITVALEKDEATVAEESRIYANRIFENIKSKPSLVQAEINTKFANDIIDNDLDGFTELAMQRKPGSYFEIKSKQPITNDTLEFIGNINNQIIDFTNKQKQKTISAQQQMFKAKIELYFVRQAHNTIYEKPKEFIDAFYKKIKKQSINDIVNYENAFEYLKKFYKRVSLVTQRKLEKQNAKTPLLLENPPLLNNKDNNNKKEK